MKKFLKQGALGLLVFIVVNAAVAAFYEYPTYQSIQNKTNRNYLKWNAVHQNENIYDLIIIGTSRAYASYNPLIIDSLLNIQSYNMATSAQDIAETYYSLQEIFEYQKPKYVVIDLFFPASDNSHEYFQTLSNSSFYNSTERRFQLLTEGYGASGILNYSIPLIKFKNYIKQDIGGLFTENKTFRKEDNWKKGYLYDTLTVNKKQISSFEPVSNFENTDFDKERFNNYFNKIKTLVEANNAKLICVRAPYPPSRLALSNIDDEGNYFKEYMTKMKIPFYDFNNFESDKYQYIDNDFADYHHPNYRGGKKASYQLVDAIKQLTNQITP